MPFTPVQFIFVGKTFYYPFECASRSHEINQPGAQLQEFVSGGGYLRNTNSSSINSEYVYREA
jgi:hypothetical protein